MNIEIYIPKHLNDIVEIINDPEYSKWLNDGNKIKNLEELYHLTFYLFKVNDEIAGFCAFRNAEKASIVDVAILKKFRGKIGKKLSLLAKEKYKIESNCKVLLTRIDKRNRQSLVFSKWVGFIKFDEDEKYNYLRLPLWAEQ